MAPQRRLVQAWVSVCIDTQHSQLLRAGIFSEPTPTTTGPRLWLPVRSFDGKAYEESEAHAMSWLQCPAAEWLRPLLPKDLSEQIFVTVGAPAEEPPESPPGAHERGMVPWKEIQRLVTSDGNIVLFRGNRVVEVQLHGGGNVTLHFRSARGMSMLLEERDLVDTGLLLKGLRLYSKNEDLPF